MGAGLPRLAVTAGEPAGVGPELIVRLAQLPLAAELVAITDRGLLERAAGRCNVVIDLHDDDGTPAPAHVPGSLLVRHVPLAAAERPGQPDPRNAHHVLATLAEAADGCLAGRYAAVVTAPLQKASINDAGIPFSGHTEFFAQRAGAEVVMMLASPELRVALATTHLPLRDVPDAVTHDTLMQVMTILDADLRSRWGLAQPRIAICGLNPHAGEGGHLGHEEIDVIIPAVAAARAAGIDVTGPFPADTLFVPSHVAGYDATLAMFHDQGLPVLKHASFGQGVNITLGLPYVRTSVDHGTALDLAGTGRADAGSMQHAILTALQMIPATDFELPSQAAAPSPATRGAAA